MVTGSMAMNYYAVPRMTRDIDVVVELSERDIKRVIEQFEPDFYVDGEAIRSALEHHSLFNVIHTPTLVKADFVIRKETEYRREEFARRRQVSVEGHPFWIVSAEDLILSKLDWAKDSHSEMQLADVRNLLRSVPQADRDYLTRWASVLGVTALLQEVSA